MPRLRLSRNLPLQSRRALTQTIARLPELEGSPISIDVRPWLTASRGKLLSGRLEQGTAVYAAAFIRRRLIVLESGLPVTKLRLILVHELFHFAWARLGNISRRAFAALLVAEWDGGARGELGESSAVGKDKLRRCMHLERSGPAWRDYVCESFCDTAAWLYGSDRVTSEFGLAGQWRAKRRRWFESTFARPRAC